MKKLITTAFLAMAITLTAAASSSGDKKGEGFFIKDNDRVVFLGDSITHQKLYTTYIEAYALTRFPEYNLTFYNCGFGGDTATLTKRFKIDDKELYWKKIYAATGKDLDKMVEEAVGKGLARDVFPLKPTVVTIEFGMNDHKYQAFRPEILRVYVRSQEELVRTLKKNGTRVALITPQPIEDMKQNPKEDVRNISLRKLSDGLKEVAAAEGVLYIDQFDPYMEIISKRPEGQTTHIGGGRKGDDVHPGACGHAIMAWTILKKFNAPALVSSATIDISGGSNKVVTENCTVSDVSYTNGVVSFDRLDKALPMPIDKGALHALERVPIIEDLNRYPMCINGLADGEYEMLIDGKPVTTITSAAGKACINLATVETPASKQADKLLYDVFRKGEAFGNRWRNIQLVNPEDPKLVECDKKIAEMEAKINALRKPVVHHFVIKPALLAGVSSAYSQQNYYISATGNDANPGTEAKPFKTLEKARDAIRAAGPRSADKKATVFIKEGVYPRTKTFELDQRDSFTTYISMPGEKVQIIGGIQIPASAVANVTDQAIVSRVIDKEAQSKIKQINLKALGITNYGELGPRGFRRAYRPAPMELVIDDQILQIARWPNVGETFIKLGKVINKGSLPRKGDYGTIPGTFEYEVDAEELKKSKNYRTVDRRPEKWTQANDLYVSGTWGEEWADDTLKVGKLDLEKGTITTTLPHLYGFNDKGWHRYWFAINLVEEIDLPGEYYIDNTTGILYFYPPVTFSEASTLFVSNLMETMIAIENAENVTFEKVNVEITRDSAIYIEGGKGHTIAGCTIRNIGGLAIQMGQGTEPCPEGKHNGHGEREDGKPWVPASRIMGNWNEYIYMNAAWNRNCGTDHKILSCNIYDTGAGGIMLGGGDRKTLTPGNSLVENCDIYRVNRLDTTYKAPINVDGVGHTIRHNHLHHSAGSGIYLHGNDHVIELNKFDHLCSDSCDMGAIYMGRDPSEAGHLIKNNFFHQVKHWAGGPVMGIYFDDGCIYAGSVIGNVFYEVAKNQVISINGGFIKEIRNNIAIDCANRLVKGEKTGKGVLTRLKNELGIKRLTIDIDATKPPYSVRHPKLLAAFKDGILEDTPVTANYVIWPKWSKGDLSQFVDGKKMNFKLIENSTVYKEIEGFEPIPFEKIGLYKDQWRK